MSASTIGSPGRTCEACGADANIHVSNLVRGVATMRHFCSACVDGIDVHRRPSRQQSSRAALLASVGGIVLILSLSADWLRFGSSEGFGWLQQFGLTFTALLVLLGAVARSPMLIVTGLLGGSLTLAADWVGFGGAEGFGWQQMLGTALGLTALVAARARTHRLARDANAR